MLGYESSAVKRSPPIHAPRILFKEPMGSLALAALALPGAKTSSYQRMLREATEGGDHRRALVKTQAAALYITWSS